MPEFRLYMVKTLVAALMLPTRPPFSMQLLQCAHRQVSPSFLVRRPVQQSPAYIGHPYSDLPARRSFPRSGALQTLIIDIAYDNDGFQPFTLTCRTTPTSVRHNSCAVTRTAQRQLSRSSSSSRTGQHHIHISCSTFAESSSARQTHCGFLCQDTNRVEKAHSTQQAVASTSWRCLV